VVVVVAFDTVERCLDQEACRSLFRLRRSCCCCVASVLVDDDVVESEDGEDVSGGWLLFSSSVKLSDDDASFASACVVGGATPFSFSRLPRRFNPFTPLPPLSED